MADDPDPWELAEQEERTGDALYAAGDATARGHYLAAQRALIPPGSVFTDPEENDRRMEAYNRLTQKLYQPPPTTYPATEHRTEARREKAFAVLKEQSGLGRLTSNDDHWRHHHLGELWMRAGRSLAHRFPAEASRACDWSIYHFERYARCWNAHLPASRWDSDGRSEMQEAQGFRSRLPSVVVEAVEPPHWVESLLDGNWQDALASFSPAPDCGPLATLLADAAHAGGRAADARRVLDEQG